MRSHAEATSGYHAKLVRAAMLLCAAAVLSYAEAIALPPLPVPGLRLGLANVAIVLALALLGPRWALPIAVGKAIVVGLAVGTLFSPVFALALGGSVAACLTMIALRKLGDRFSVVGWSVAGAAAHVGAQLALASLLVGSNLPFLLAPFSLLLSVVTGLAVGLASRWALAEVSRGLHTVSETEEVADYAAASDGDTVLVP